jgi:serine/threonine protein kinase
MANDCSVTTERVSLDSFEIIRHLGKGGFGRVYLARKRGTTELYAIKVIPSANDGTNTVTARVLRERTIHSLVQHQFLTHLYWSFQGEDAFYLVLEYVPGGDLETPLSEKTEFSPEQIRLYIAEIGIALLELHKRGIIYRDLKPDNILLQANGHLKLADFGLSVEIDEAKNESLSMCGTLHYLSPEMVRGELQTAAVDWWALGILAFRLMTGYLPFQSGTPTRLFNHIKNTEVRIPRIVSRKHPNGELLIRDLLAKDPTKRLGSPGTDFTRHPYFAGLDWKMVAKMQYEPDFKPSSVPREPAVRFGQVNSEEVASEEAAAGGFKRIAGFSFQNKAPLPVPVSFEDSILVLEPEDDRYT